MSKSDGLSGLRKRPVFIEEYNVWVKPLTVGQTETLTEWSAQNSGSSKIVSLLLSLSLCDADGGLLLSSPEAAHDLDRQLCESLCARIRELNGLGESSDPKADSSAAPA